MYKDRIKHIHISDYKDGKPHVDIGKGVVDFEKFFRVLRKNRYDGYIVLELEKRSKNDFMNNLNVLRKFIQD